MRLHLLEHDTDGLSDTYMTRWAKAKGHVLAQTYVCRNEALPSLDTFDWLMIMGGSPHVWEKERLSWLSPEKEFIAHALDQNKIILGICFGAQLLAQALGGTVSENRYDEIGWHRVNLTEKGRQSFLFDNIPERFTTFHWHSDHFSIPPGCTRLAFSKATPNQAFVMAGRPIAGLQFHPEYTRKMVRYFAGTKGHEWVPGPFVGGVEAVLDQTKALQNSYGLMEALLDNMEQEFGG